MKTSILGMLSLAAVSVRAHTQSVACGLKAS